MKEYQEILDEVIDYVGVTIAGLANPELNYEKVYDYATRVINDDDWEYNCGITGKEIEEETRKALVKDVIRLLVD